MDVITISCLAAEDILLSRISSIEGSIVVVRKLNTCEAVLFSADDFFVAVVIPNELLLILSADEICNFEIKFYALRCYSASVRVQLYACRAHCTESRPTTCTRIIAAEKKPQSIVFKLNN